MGIHHQAFYALFHCHTQQMDIPQQMIHASSSRSQKVDGMAALADGSTDGNFRICLILFWAESQNLRNLPALCLFLSSQLPA